MSISSVVSWDCHIIDELGSVSHNVDSSPSLFKVRISGFFGKAIDLGFSEVFVVNVEPVNAYGEGVLSAVERGLEIISTGYGIVLCMVRNESQMNSVGLSTGKAVHDDFGVELDVGSVSGLGLGDELEVQRIVTVLSDPLETVVRGDGFVLL